MRYIRTLILLIFCLSAEASTMTFYAAKEESDRFEAELSMEDSQTLVLAQGKFAGEAFPYCATTTGENPSSFTVVVQLSRDGKVVKSWLKGSSNFARCFREKMEKNFAYKHSQDYFFTSFEYTHQP